MSNRRVPVGVLALKLGLLFLIIDTQLVAAQPVGYGDSVLHLGTNGYASIPDSQFQGFNFRTNFSLEVALNIEATAAGGRWPVLLGKKYSPPQSTPGFALSINQGQFKTVGQQLYAVVADGTQQASLSSRFFQGIVHAVMTWDSRAKVLQLYMNGSLEGANTNTLISANLQNTEDLKLGGPSNYGQSLQRDILFCRIWNRILSPAEISMIWTNFTVSGQHVTPPGFNRTALVSEWLLYQTQNSTHLLDSQGSNPLQLQGSATLLQGSGPLTLQAPAGGSTNIAKSVALKASGGLGSLGNNPVKPVQYYFQIDQTNTFDSAALKSSGWLAGYGSWKPLLKPATAYFWRVGVRDSSGNPVLSGYVATNSFSTMGSSDWFVRPGVYKNFDPNTGAPIATIGIYGLQDGTSYSNAWNGLFSIQWGEGAVEPGDNLYVCGTHVYTVSNSSFLGSQAITYISESGGSTDSPITIRMDLPWEPGTMWGAARNEINGGATWYGPDANGVYFTSNLLYSADYWINGTNAVVLNRESGSTWIGDSGATFMTNGIWYVKTPDGNSPGTNICTTGLGYQFNLGRSSNIRFYNCRLRNATPIMDTAGWNPTIDTQTPLPLSSYITFDGCDLRFNSEITPTPGNDHWTVRNCELAFSQYGVYTFLNQRSFGANSLTVQSNYIHDMGTPRFPHQDAHGVGIQGGDGHLIEGNRIENTGSAIEFWTYSQPMRNHTVRYNFIKNIHVMPVTTGAGIVISGDNIASVAGLRTGIKIYGNIIMNTGQGATETFQGYGIGCNNKDYTQIFDNTVYNATTGISLSVVNGNPQANIVNNVVANTKGLYPIFVAGDTASTTNLFVDYNLYSPVTNSATQLLIYSDQSHDEHSVLSSPLFFSASPELPADFRPRQGSAAIRAGTPVGLSCDFFGTPIPTNVPPDMGALQSSSSIGVLPPSDLHVISISGR